MPYMLVTVDDNGRFNLRHLGIMSWHEFRANLKDPTPWGVKELKGFYWFKDHPDPLSWGRDVGVLLKFDVETHNGINV